MSAKPLVHFVEWKKVFDTEIDSVLCQLLDWGVDTLVAHPCWWYRECEQEGFLAWVNGKIRRAGLTTPACHAIWGAKYDLSKMIGEERMERLQQHSDFLLCLGSMGVKTYTMHAGFVKVNKITETNWSDIARNVEALLPAAEDAGITLALENGQEDAADLEKMLRLVSSFAHKNLGICFDSGHAHCFSGIGVDGALALCANEIVTCHLHDNDGSDDQHNPPGEGSIDWKSMIAALKKCPRLIHAETEAGDWSEKNWRKFRELWDKE